MPRATWTARWSCRCRLVSQTTRSGSRQIAAETAVRKKKSRPQGGTLFRNIPIQRAWLRFAPHQRIMTTYAANVPGPPVPVYLAGARVLELFPIVPILGNISIGVGALSYAGQFNITVVADRELCPDLDVFVDGMRGSLAALRVWRPAHIGSFGPATQGGLTAVSA